MNRVIYVICILAVLFFGAFIVFSVLNNNNNNNNKDINSEITENNVTDNSSNTNEQNDMINNDVQESNNESVNQDETSNDYDDGTFRVRQIDNETYRSYYEILEEEKIAKDSVNIEEQGDNLTITIVKNNLNDMLFEHGSEISYDTQYNISNISASDVENIFYGMEGQDWDYPLVFILQKNGNVKGIDMEHGYKTGEFIAKNISELKDVTEFKQVSVSLPNDSGYNAVVAITKDGMVYEVGAN